MQDGQDWCLTCGTAAPGSLGQRPGWRAASTVIGLTLVLVLGAIGASYAALTGNDKPSTPPAAPAQAQVTPPPAATPPATTPPAATQTTPTTPTTPSQQATPTTKLPKVKTPKAPTSGGSPITPTTPTPATPSTPAATPTTPSTTTPPQPTDTGPKPIKLAAGAATTYDPYGRSKASGQTERAVDGDKATSWYVDPKDPQQVGVGFAVNLGQLQGIREIELQTSTPGFRIEVYATDDTELPPDILDTRWSHITNVSDVGKKDGGKQKIVLGAGTTKYRNLLLWFTKPPTDGARLRLTELQLLG
jgi:hypothetical protein